MTAPTPDTSLGEALEAAVGPDRVHPDARLDGVWTVSATATEEVRAVLATAQRRGVPVRAVSSEGDRAGLRAPRDGGVLLDLAGMNRIVDIHAADGWAVVEPGVTWQALDRRLQADRTEFTVPSLAAPSRLTLWSTAVLGGSLGPALPWRRPGGRFRLAEAVTPGDELLAGADWIPAPGPDLSPLLMGRQGGAAVVTRVAVALPPRRRHQRRLGVPATRRGPALDAALRLAREGLFDEVLVVPWALLRRFHGIGGTGPLHRDPGEPEAWLLVDFTAETRAELEYKRLRVGQAVSRVARRGGAFEEPVPLEHLAAVFPPLRALADLPLTLPEPAPDARWALLSAEGPVSRLHEAAERLEGVWASRALTPTILARAPQGGHVGWLHAVDPVGPAGLDPVVAAHTEGADTLRELDFAVRRHLPEASPAAPRLDPALRALAGRLRRLFDPEGLLDPAHWGLSVLP